MADTLLREKNGKEELWYSEEYFNKMTKISNNYLTEQIERAYQAGLNRGVRVVIHSVQPITSVGLNDLTQVFYNKIEEEYKKAFENEEVWKIGSGKKKYGE